MGRGMKRRKCILRDRCELSAEYEPNHVGEQRRGGGGVKRSTATCVVVFFVSLEPAKREPPAKVLFCLFSHISSLFQY